MPKKTPVIDEQKWLEDYEKGKPVATIARERHRDVRTVTKGIDRARRQRDAGLARAGLMKEALLRHQLGLLGTVKEIMSGLTVPPVDSAPLAWQGNGGVLEAAERGKNDGVVADEVVSIAPLAAEIAPEWSLLQEHLKADPLWKAVGQYKRVLAAYTEAKTAFQVKTVLLLGETTGFEVVESKEAVDSPFVYVDTAGPLFYQVTVRRVVGIPDRTNPEDRIVVDTKTGEISHGIGSTLAKAPGKEEKCKADLVEVLCRLRKCREAVELDRRYKELQEMATRANRLAEDIHLMGLVPGGCRICRRLGL